MQCSANIIIKKPTLEQFLNDVANLQMWSQYKLSIRVHIKDQVK